MSIRHQDLGAGARCPSTASAPIGLSLSTPFARQHRFRVTKDLPPLHRLRDGSPNHAGMALRLNGWDPGDQSFAHQDKGFQVDEFSEAVTLIIQMVTFGAGLVAALWAYTKFVLERGILAPAQLDMKAAVTDTIGGWRLLEVTINIRNVGSSTLVASDLRADIRYLGSSDSIELFDVPASNARYGRAVFPHSVRRQVRAGSANPPSSPEGDGRGFLVVDHDTFVQANVNQPYTFVTRIPDTARFLLLFASFRYAQRPRRLARVLLRLSRRLGLIQYTLDHVREPHTVERLVDVHDVIMGRRLAIESEGSAQGT